MSSPAAPPRSAGVPGRALAALAALAAALGAAFVAAPRTLAASGPGGGFADQRHLIDAVRAAFVGHWLAGDRRPSPDLRSVVEYWLRYHVAKAVIAASLLIVLVMLGRLLWKAFLRAGGRGAGRRAGLAAAGTLVATLSLVSLMAAMANVQGAAAPYASLLPMLTGGGTDAELAGTLDQVRQQLADAQGAGAPTPPAVEVMISDFARYHVAMAAIAAIVAVALTGLSVVSWGRFARPRADRLTRRVLGSFGVVTALLSLAMLVVAVANTTTAADPAPALLAAFNGGW